MPPFARRPRLVHEYNFPRKVASFGEVRVDFARMELVRNGDGVQLTARSSNCWRFCCRMRNALSLEKSYLTRSGAITPIRQRAPWTCISRSCVRKWKRDLAPDAILPEASSR